MSNGCCDEATTELDQEISDAEDTLSDLQSAYVAAAAIPDWPLAEDISYELEVLAVEIDLLNAESSGLSTGCGCCS